MFTIHRNQIQIFISCSLRVGQSISPISRHAPLTVNSSNSDDSAKFTRSVFIGGSFSRRRTKPISRGKIRRLSLFCGMVCTAELFEVAIKYAFPSLDVSVKEPTNVITFLTSCSHHATIVSFLNKYLFKLHLLKLNLGKPMPEVRTRTSTSPSEILSSCETEIT